MTTVPCVLPVLAKAAIGGSRGARDLRNVIRRKVEDKIASLIVNTIDKPLKAVTVSVDNEEIVLVSL